MEIPPTAHACLPFIYVDRECFVFVADEPQLRGINHNPIAVVRCSLDVLTGD